MIPGMLQGGAGTWSDGKLTTRIGRNGKSVRTVRLKGKKIAYEENMFERIANLSWRREQRSFAE